MSISATSFVTAALIFLLLPASWASLCTLQDGGCTYNIHLTHRNGDDLQGDGCGTKEQQIFLDSAQNDYAVKIGNMEKNFLFLRDAHEHRIQELESTVKEIRGKDKPTRFPPSEDTEDDFQKPQELAFRNDVTLRKLEDGFNKLRDGLNQKTEELIEATTKLNETTAMLHEAQLQHFQTSQDLLNAENEITLLKRERAVLKNQLKDRIYRLDISTQKATDCEVQSEELREQMTELFRSENTLKEELMTVQMRLNKSKEAQDLLQGKHATLKGRHEKTKLLLKIREQEMIQCFKAKTSVFCGFEDPDLCGFTNVNDSTDFFDWERGKGPTPSSGTGPSEDNTCRGPNGHFMFIEASAKARGNNAILFSPLYRGLSEQCVEFFYHMNGKHIGTLNVYAQPRGDVLKSAWRAYGNQGNVWTNARLAIPQELATVGYQIAFEGITEKGYLGDISIDDVSIRDGPCPVNEKLVPVLVEINSTTISKNLPDFTKKGRKKQKDNVP